MHALVTLYVVPSQVAETLPEGVLEKMHAPPKPDVPIVDVHDLASADGLCLRFPHSVGLHQLNRISTGFHQQLSFLIWMSLRWVVVHSASQCILLCRYGMPPAQFKAFMDATGQLWQSGALVGKPVTFITSTASLGGGQEVTISSSKPRSPTHT